MPIDILKWIDYILNKMKNRKVIKVEVPQELWDADMSFWNIVFMRKDIVGTWMESIRNIYKNIK